MPNHADLEDRFGNTDLEDRFWNTAENLVDQYEMTVSFDCEFLIRSFIREGIGQMDTEDRLFDHISRELAEANLTVFVSRMVIIALMQGSRELDTDIFHIAEAAFAVWPFHRG